MSRSQLFRSARSVVVFDFETTGLSPDNGDRTIEVGAVLMEDGRITDRFQKLMNPGIAVPVFVENLTGITSAMVREAEPSAVVIKEFLAFIEGHNLVAHNASFDERFLRAEAKRVQRQISPVTCCSLLLSRRLLPLSDSHSLGFLADRYKLPRAGEAHRALADAEVTAHLWLLLCDQLRFHHQFSQVPFAMLQELTQTARHKLPARYSAWQAKIHARSAET